MAGAVSWLGAAEAPPTPAPAEVLAVAERVADWQLRTPSNWKPYQWHNGALYTGYMALSRVSARPDYEKAMLELGRKMEWGLGPRPYDADDHCVVQTWTELYFKYKDPAMIAPAIKAFDFVLENPKTGDLEFSKPNARDQWSWCDALFMAPPAWLRLSVATGNRAYLDFMVENWWKTSDYLYSSEEHLYFRDSNYFSRREPNGAKIFWSRGNGWVMAGLARVLPLLPRDHPARGRFEQQFREMAAKVLTLQQPDGLWRASLLDPAAYPARETSGSGFFCFALSWGINYGMLDRATYGPAVLRAWHALADCVNADGKLTHVQPVGQTPKTFDPEHSDVFGVGAFLLAASEVYRLVGGESDKK